MKVLVVFGSKRGGTAGLAHMIGGAFRRHGCSVEVRDAALPGPIQADVVLIGGALYLNRWHKDARRFAKRHEKTLRQLPVWLFSSGPLDHSARAGDLAPVDQVQWIAQQLEACGHMTFGGRLEPDAHGFLVRQMARTMAGDWRDQHQVDEWVRDILHDLGAVPVAVPAATQVVIPRQRAAAEAPAPALARGADAG